MGEALTLNKPYTVLGCKQHYSKLKKAIIFNPGTVKEDLTILASMDEAVLRNKDTSGKAIFKEVNKDEELSMPKVATLLTSKSTKGVPGDSTTSKAEAAGEALTLNKSHPASGCKQHYNKLKKVITPDLKTVNNRGSPPEKPLRNRIITANYINTIAKLIREALLTRSTTVDTN